MIKTIERFEGYEVFANSGKLFHRWWFEHNHDRKIKKGHEIHHKNLNKRDNRIENLVELSPKEHERLHKQRYKRRHYSSLAITFKYLKFFNYLHYGKHG